MIKMKDINFSWPFVIGLAAWLYAASALLKLAMALVNGSLTLKYALFTFLIVAMMGLLGWTFVKIAYANKEAENEK